MDIKNLFIFAITFLIFISLVFAQEAEFLKLKWNFIICNILCLILFISAGIAAVIIILAGLKYISSESSKQVNEAKRRILYAIVAMIFILIATPFVNYLVEPFTPMPENFTCWCTNLGGGGGGVTPSGNFTSPILVVISHPGDGGEFANDTPIQFVGYVYYGKSLYDYEWSSNPPAISRTVNDKAYAMDTFSASLARGDYTITLKVTDSEGKIGTDSVKIKVIIPKPPT